LALGHGGLRAVLPRRDRRDRHGPDRAPSLAAAGRLRNAANGPARPAPVWCRPRDDVNPARSLGRGSVDSTSLRAQPAATAARGCRAGVVLGLRSTRRVRTRNPPPTSSRAMPMTIAKVATLSAKKEVFSAVVSAVSVTQMLRAPFSTGLPVALSTAAAFSSLVGLPAAVR